MNWNFLSVHLTKRKWSKCPLGWNKNKLGWQDCSVAWNKNKRGWQDCSVGWNKKQTWVTTMFCRLQYVSSVDSALLNGAAYKWTGGSESALPWVVATDSSSFLHKRCVKGWRSVWRKIQSKKWMFSWKKSPFPLPRCELRKASGWFVSTRKEHRAQRAMNGKFQSI